MVASGIQEQNSYGNRTLDDNGDEVIMAGSMTPAEAAQGQDYADYMAQALSNADPSSYAFAEVAGLGGVGGGTRQFLRYENQPGNHAVNVYYKDTDGSTKMTTVSVPDEVSQYTDQIAGTKDGIAYLDPVSGKPLTRFAVDPYQNVIDNAVANDQPDTQQAPDDPTMTVVSQPSRNTSFATVAINGNDGGFTPLVSIDPYNPADVQLNMPSVDVPVLTWGGGDDEPNPSQGNDTLQRAGGGSLGAKIATMRAAWGDVPIIGQGPGVTVNGEKFNFSFYRPAGTRKPVTVPKSGKAYLFRPGNPKQQLRLDLHELPVPGSGGPKTWHWNAKGVASAFGNQLDHSEAGAALAGRGVMALRWGGRLFIAGGIYYSYLAIKNSSHPVDEAGRQASGWAGSIAGGEVGAEVGAGIGGSVGALFGGVGAIPGAAAGAFVGGLVGGVIGWEGGTRAYNLIHPPVLE